MTELINRTFVASENLSIRETVLAVDRSCSRNGPDQLRTDHNVSGGGDNTVVGDVANDATPQGGVNPRQRGRTNK
ncbi:hypothetical protein QA646_25200 (plasmid) [Rhizobium sp. CB3090]|uniref:hypothetical protein n=1 Tax=Rhizobium sp. CB3090 TaxID=3039156 RepID=UPI0024B28005|nr:hypothetical protein [Rhizobium sp. CB3090]WFU11681.1 hypothetical protein QA646_25200 [Rhizobium sp. CB3090]